MVYNGPAFVKGTHKIAPNEFKSMTEEFEYSPSIGSSKMSFHNGSYYFKTANRTHGPFSQASIDKYGLATSWEDNGHRMDAWKANAESNPSINHDIMPVHPDIMYFEGSTKPLDISHPNDTKLPLRTTKTFNLISSNKLGYYASRVSEFDFLLGDMVMLGGKKYAMTQDLLKKYAQYGYDVSTANTNGVRAIGIDNAVDMEFLANYRPHDGWLAIEKDSLSKLKGKIPDNDFQQAYFEYSALHEFGHAAGVKGTRKGERIQGLIMSEFYAEQASKTSGKKKFIYEMMAKEAAEYAEFYSAKEAIKREFKGKGHQSLNRFAVLKAFYRREAIEIGLKGQELENYIKSRMMDWNGSTLDTSIEEDDLFPKNLEDIVDGEGRPNDKAESRTTPGKAENLEERSTSKYSKARGKNYEGKEPVEYSRKIAKGKPTSDNDEGPTKAEIDSSEYQSMSDAKESSNEAPSEAAPD